MLAIVAQESGNGIAIRDAVPADAGDIAQLYAHYVRTSSATFEETPPDAAEIERRLHHIRNAGLPWRVARDGSGKLAGYAYASTYRVRSAYRYTLENSVYVAPEAHGKGLGTALMRDLIALCSGLGYRQMLAVIGGSDNESSIRLHTRLGFKTVAQHTAIGLKFGRWVDVVHMQLALGDGASSMPDGEPQRLS